MKHQSLASYHDKRSKIVKFFKLYHINVNIIYYVLIVIFEINTVLLENFSNKNTNIFTFKTLLYYKIWYIQLRILRIKNKQFVVFSNKHLRIHACIYFGDIKAKK